MATAGGWAKIALLNLGRQGVAGFSEAGKDAAIAAHSA
jgi:hypothetical protein